MSELKEKGIKLELKNENYTLYVDGKFIIESKDLDYVLEYIKDKETFKETLLNTKTNVAELW